MFQDVQFNQSAGYWDLSIGSDGDFKKLDSFDTAIWLSLIGSDRRASETEEAVPQYRRGWIGNQYQPVELGSKLWLIPRRLTNKCLNDARTYASQALDWFVSLGYLKSIVVTTERNLISSTLSITIKMEPFEGETVTRTYLLWKNTPAS